MIFDTWRIPVHSPSISYTSMTSFHCLFFQRRLIISNFPCGMDQNYLRKKWAYCLFMIIQKDWRSDSNFNMRSFSLRYMIRLIDKINLKKKLPVLSNYNYALHEKFWQRLTVEQRYIFNGFKGKREICLDYQKASWLYAFAI